MDFRVSVSDLAGYHFGDDKRKNSAIVDYGADIAINSTEQNSEMLYGKFPEKAAVAGLVHDAAVVLYAKEPGFADLDPDREDIADLLKGMVSGEKPRTAETLSRDVLGERIRGLEREYDIRPSELIEQEVYGKTVEDLLEDVAEYRSNRWREELGNVEAEKWVEDENLRGRADLVVDDELREVKAGTPSKIDEYQAFVYGDVIGVENVTVDYPVLGRRIPVEDEWDVDEDVDEFKEAVARFVRSQTRGIEDGYDEALGRTVLRAPDETINEFRERMLEEVPEEQDFEITENATRNALEEIK